jgi:hypothetical protein
MTSASHGRLRPCRSESSAPSQVYFAKQISPMIRSSNSVALTAVPEMKSVPVAPAKMPVPPVTLAMALNTPAAVSKID